jgi:hypothetical protein
LKNIKSVILYGNHIQDIRPPVFFPGGRLRRKIAETDHVFLPHHLENETTLQSPPEARLYATTWSKTS